MAQRTTSTLAAILAVVCLAQIGFVAAASPRDWYHRYIICRKEFNMGGDVGNITRIYQNGGNGSSVGESYYLTLEQGVNGKQNLTGRDHSHLYAANLYANCAVTNIVGNETFSFCTGDFVFVNSTGTLSIQGTFRTKALSEFNVSVTGGTGAYNGATGYAKGVNASPVNGILFYVYLQKQPKCEKIYDPYFA